MANSTAFLFNSGKVPGWPSVMGEILVLGSLPNAALSPLNSLLAVNSCACTSRPTMVSYPFSNEVSDLIYYLFKGSKVPKKAAFKEKRLSREIL